MIVIVLWFFPYDGVGFMQCEIVVIPAHTHLLFRLLGEVGNVKLV